MALMVESSVNNEICVPRAILNMDFLYKKMFRPQILCKKKWYRAAQKNNLFLASWFHAADKMRSPALIYILQ